MRHCLISFPDPRPPTISRLPTHPILGIVFKRERALMIDEDRILNVSGKTMKACFSERVILVLENVECFTRWCTRDLLLNVNQSLLVSSSEPQLLHQKQMGRSSPAAAQQHPAAFLCIHWFMLVYAGVCWCMLHAGVCWYMLVS